MEVAVILVRPREEGNVGAAARAMANMGLRRLVLVAPVAQIGGVARAFAVGAHDILESATRVETVREALAPFRFVVGTTSTRDRTQTVPLIEASGLAGHLAEAAVEGPVALLFGPEVGGLTAEELALCNVVVTVPCALEQPTLNLAQSVLLLAYELRRAGLQQPGAEVTMGQPEAATSGELAGLFDHVAMLLQRIRFDRDSTFAGVMRDLRSAAGRARLQSREVAVLRGICRRALHALGSPSGGNLSDASDASDAGDAGDAGDAEEPR